MVTIETNNPSGLPSGQADKLREMIRECFPGLLADAAPQLIGMALWLQKNPGAIPIAMSADGVPPPDVVGYVCRLLDEVVAGKTNNSSAIEVHGLRIDPDSHTCTYKGRSIELAPKEFQTLLYMARNPGRVYSRGQIKSIADGNDAWRLADTTTTVRIARIRKKLGENGMPNHEALLQNVRGVGYRVRP